MKDDQTGGGDPIGSPHNLLIRTPRTNEGLLPADPIIQLMHVTMQIAAARNARRMPEIV